MVGLLTHRLKTVPLELKVKKKRFKAEVLSGHKENAIEVPFDPAREWDIEPQPLWRGRRGHRVLAKMKGITFESAIVPRQKKFYLLIDAEAKKAASVSAGVRINVEIKPYAE
jgi:uncharacterized protein DUF1905